MAMKAEVVVIARTSLAAARSSRLTEVEPQRFTNHLRKPFPGEFTNFMYHFAIRFPQSYGRRLVPIVGQVPNITIIYGHFEKLVAFVWPTGIGSNAPVNSTVDVGFISKHDRVAFPQGASLSPSSVEMLAPASGVTLAFLATQFPGRHPRQAENDRGAAHYGTGTSICDRGTRGRRPPGQ